MGDGLTEAMDLTTPTGRAMAGLLSVFAEFERQVLRERIIAGLAQARRNGTRLGRPRTVANKKAEARKLLKAGLTKSAIARRLSMRARLCAACCQEPATFCLWQPFSARSTFY